MDGQISLLFSQLRGGNQLAFDKLYELTKKQVYFSIYAVIKSHSLSEDIMQDTYVKFLDNLQRIDSHKNIVSYLITIGRNLAIDYLRKNSRIFDLEDYNNFEEVIGDTGSTIHEEEEVFQLMKEVLNNSEFEIVVLHVIEEMPHRKIAEYLGKPLGTITWAYNNAMKKIRKRMGEKND